jgi:hypothetical protein
MGFPHDPHITPVFWSSHRCSKASSGPPNATAMPAFVRDSGATAWLTNMADPPSYRDIPVINNLTQLTNQLLLFQCGAHLEGCNEFKYLAFTGHTFGSFCFLFSIPHRWINRGWQHWTLPSHILAQHHLATETNMNMRQAVTVMVTLTLIL